MIARSSMKDYLTRASMLLSHSELATIDRRPGRRYRGESNRSVTDSLVVMIDFGRHLGQELLQMKVLDEQLHPEFAN